MNLIIPSGISGSGKSRLYNVSIDKDVKLVCPDDIRRELNGNINDQSNGNKIFEIAHNRVSNFLKNREDVYFSATNLRSVYVIGLLNDVLDSIGNLKSELNVTFYILTDSFDVEKCISRVRGDIDSGVDRSDVSEEVIRKQAQRFNSLIDSLENGVLKKYLIENNIRYNVNYV